MSALSIIVCTYNNNHLLQGCLNCFKNQFLNHEVCFELLVVDNNSSDKTREVVEGFIQEGFIPNLKYIFEPNPGLTNARLAGVKNAAYSWIAFIDDDVRISPNWIASAISFIQEHPRAGVVSGKIELQYTEVPSPAALKCEAALCRIDYGPEPFDFQNSGLAMRLAGAALILNKQAVEETGWLKKRFLTDRLGKSLSSGGDTEIILRIKNKGWEIWYTPSLLATHVIPPSRTTIKYLCRLHRGLACSSAQLRAIGFNQKVPLSLQLQSLSQDIAFTLRRAFAWIFHDLIKNQSLGDKRLIQIFEGIGRIESCLNFLVRPISLDS